MLEILQNVFNKFQHATGANSWHFSTNREVISSSSTPSWQNRLKSLPQYTLSQVSEHFHPNDCWIVIYDIVCDVSQFLINHPGGEFIIIEHAGRDATIPFKFSGHSREAHNLLEEYCIGILVENERLYMPSELIATNVGS